MLVLSRKPGETLKINEDIVITVVAVQGQRVKIGIEAPNSYHILRGELPRFAQPPGNGAANGAANGPALAAPSTRPASAPAES